MARLNVLVKLCGKIQRRIDMSYCSIHTCNNCIECALEQVEGKLEKVADRIIHSMEEIESRRSIYLRARIFFKKRRMDKMIAEKKVLYNLLELNYFYDVMKNSWRLNPDGRSLSEKQIGILTESGYLIFGKEGLSD